LPEDPAELVAAVQTLATRGGGGRLATDATVAPVPAPTATDDDIWDRDGSLQPGFDPIAWLTGLAASVEAQLAQDVTPAPEAVAVGAPASTGLHQVRPARHLGAQLGRPILFVVVAEDDVRAALAGDLEARFGGDCRIVAEGGPAEAVESLERLAAASEDV